LGKGSLAVGFSLALGQLLIGKAAATQSSSFAVDSWLTIDGAGQITVYIGKVELGTGMETALLQIATEELSVSPSMMTFVQGDTSLPETRVIPPAARPGRNSPDQSADRASMGEPVSL
jgi:CO/xanthine dehydrogenase Mo-binding subunit